ncbi:bifunctional metallophosphatase/5'-nucleotidase [Marisediminicola sp. LYQ85]|uniref:bifunctional metallophosphatase/5'-nucleotidase n=1 Tax=Marisediminicola sp. LYQ85 TaxID=3391062 RepID=UPI003983935F
MRRSRAASTAALACLTLTLALPASAAFAAPGDPGEPIELTVMATTDTHGHVFDWDYFRNAPYDTDETLGLTRVGTAVEAARAEKGDESVLVVDNGDALQGTPLTYYYGLGDGRDGVLDGTTTHPVASAFNAIGYDATTVGNHEYNYGLDLLDAYEGDLDASMLGANVIDVATGEPYHEPYDLIERTIDGVDVTVGVLGLVTPGVRVWDKQYVDGVLEFRDMVETAQQWVPEIAEQADVVVVLAHTGQGDVADEGYDPALLEEDVAGNIARLVPGIDLLVAGHSHQDVPQDVVTNVAGEQVLITQPRYWAGSVSEVTLNLVNDTEGGLDVDWSEGFAPTVEKRDGTEIATESQAVVDAVGAQHQTAIDYVNTAVATSVTELPATTSRYEDTAIIDFINNVQSETVEAGLADTEFSDLPVISQASPFSRTAVFPEGEVTIRDIAGLYIYENTLLGVRMTGAEVREYLEYSARYFTQVEEGAEFDPETGTNANDIPDYAYDVLSGVNYAIDISQPVGSRITGLEMPDGTPIADDDEFVMAVNNYRQSGGSGYPAIADAPVVYDERLEIRQLLIEWASANNIDPADFFVENWSLITAPLAVDPTDPTDPTDPPVTAPGSGDDGAGAPGAGDDSGVGSDGDTAPAAGSGADDLAYTGASTSGLLVPALALLVAGLGLWAFGFARRRARMTE